MRKSLYYILSCIILLAVLGSVLFMCLRNNSNNVDASVLKVYLIDNQDLQDGTLGSDSRVLFNGNDVKEFKWEEQEIIFKPEFLKKCNTNYRMDIYEIFNSDGSKLLGAEFTDRFVIFLNDEKIYGGYFKYPMYSSYYPVGAIIKDIENGIKIKWNGIDDVTDVRYDDRLYNFLKEKKLLYKYKN